MTHPIVQTITSDLKELRQEAYTTMGQVSVDSQQLLLTVDLALYLVKRLTSEEIVQYLASRMK